jgi:hypothetical protein
MGDEKEACMMYESMRHAGIVPDGKLCCILDIGNDRGDCGDSQKAKGVT